MSTDSDVSTSSPHNVGESTKLTYTVEDAIEKIGFGKFQVKVLAMVGYSWSADSLEMSLLAILAPAIRCYWNLSHWHEAFLTTIVFIGMFLATYGWGYSSDNHGRRKVLIFASTGVFIFGLASAFSLDYWMLVLLRGLVGACMGGIVQGTTLIVEFLPVATRGLTVNLSSEKGTSKDVDVKKQIFWSLGTSIEILTAMFVMPRYGWRYLLFLSAWPILLFVVLALILKYPPESIRFLASNGQYKEAMEVLEKAARNNKKDLPEGELICPTVKTSRRGSLLELFRNGQWKITVLLWIIWFASHFNIYGLALLTTALYSSQYTCYGDTQNSKATDTCKVLTQQDYEHFFYVLAADFPAILLTALMADTLGRKWLQAIGFFVMGFFFSLLFICTSSRNLTTFFLFGIRCFAAIADIGGYIYTPEVYPTHVRGIAMGSCSGISRIGCMLTPFVAQVLTHKSLHLALATYLAVSILGGVCSLLLPIETKGKGLEEINRELQSLSSEYDLLLSEINTDPAYDFERRKSKDNNDSPVNRNKDDTLKSPL